MLKRICLLVALPALLSACGDGTSTETLDRTQTQGVVLEGASIGGPFELTDTKGEQVTWADFDGQYRMVYFGYTFCPDVCPFDIQKMAQTIQLLEQSDPELASQIQPIFITIDPERDTPEVIAEFLSNFGDGFIGLTGTAEQVKTAADAFKASYSKGEDVTGGGYLMGHTNLVYLMGKQGEPLVALPVDLGPEAMAQDVRRWAS